ncbi:MAG: hypothetical protein ACRERV_08980, partial [Methylococcales bacterium]
LIALLPSLKVVVLVGRKAEAAQVHVAKLGVPFLSSYHPSPKNYAMALEKWKAIPNQWARVVDYFK